MLIINDYVCGGGAEIVMQNIINFLHDKYYITVMTFDDNMEASKTMYPSNVKYHRMGIVNNPFSRLNPLHYCVSIYNRLKIYTIQKKEYDIVIANKEGQCMKLASKVRAQHRYGWVHVDYQCLYWAKCFFTDKKEVACMQRYDRIICVSQSAADSVKKVIGDPGNIVVRYNPINYKIIQEKAKETIEISKEPNKLLFVAVGRIVEGKNFKALARVCAKLCKNYEFEVWIVGDGNERTDVERILQNESCSCVKILGMKSNPYPYIAQADFCVSTSSCESYGLVIQEALVLGVPVLTTRCPAIEECFDRQFGMMVDCNDQAIEQGMRYALEHRECVEKYRNAIKQNYNKEALWDERLASIEELLRS